MTIVQTLNLEDFIQAFKQADRDYFSYDGYEALYNYLEEMSEEMKQPFMFYVIDICSDFTEYNSLEEIQEEYKGSVELETLEALHDYATVLELPNNNGFVISAF